MSIPRRVSRSLCSARTLIIICLAAFISISVSSGGRAESGGSVQSSASPATTPDTVAMIDATVVDLKGTVATISGGIPIEISTAWVSTVAGFVLDSGAVKVGSRIRASILIPSEPGTPFVARFIQLRADNEIIFGAQIEAVELSDGLPIGIVAGHRRFLFSQGTFFDFGPGFKKLKVGRTVTIAATPDESGEFIATRVYLGFDKSLTGIGFF